MSYILDALRKSEQERQRGQVPDLNSYQDIPAPVETARNIWPWVAAAAVVINLVVILMVWAPWRAAEVSDTGLARQAVVPAAGASSAAPARQQQDSEPAPVARAATTPAPQQQVAAAPAVRPAPQPTQPVPARSEPVPTTVVEDNRPQIQAQPTIVSPDQPELPVQSTVENTPAPNVAYMPQLEELPANERQGIPDMTFSSHMYSSIPRYRSVIINGKRLKEGDYFTPNLQLREITDKGVIMSNGGTLFSVDVLGRWAQ